MGIAPNQLTMMKVGLMLVVLKQDRCDRHCQYCSDLLELCWNMSYIRQIAHVDMMHYY